jgi:hypothetical protein
MKVGLLCSAPGIVRPSRTWATSCRPFGAPGIGELTAFNAAYEVAKALG